MNKIAEIINLIIKDDNPKREQKRRARIIIDQLNILALDSNDGHLCIMAKEMKEKFEID